MTVLDPPRVPRAPAPSSPSPPASPSPFGPPGHARRRWLFVAAGVVLAAAGAYLLARREPTPTAPAAGHAHGAAATEPKAMPVSLGARDQGRIGVTFAPVLLAALDRPVRAVAQVKYDETRVKVVAPLIEGWVDQLYVNFTGQAVRPGEPLFSIYAPMVVAAEEELLLSKRLTFDIAQGTPEAGRNARDLLEAARRRLRYWGVSEAEIRRVEATGEVRRTVTLRSPYAGVVVEKPVVAGQRLMPGDVAFRIADLSRVWLEGEIFERDLATVRLGLSVTAELTALPGDIRRGRVSYIYPTVDPQTRTTRIRVELANPGLALKPGMYATIRFDAPTARVLSVPRSAILSTGERNLVFVRDPQGRFVPRAITLGFASDDRVEVMSGLALDDTVVSSATFLVDAESNLGSLLGGMGNMPGMDIGSPAKAPAAGSGAGVRK